MNIASPPISLPDLIADVSDQLTPAEERIAQLVLDDPTLVAFGTVAELARRVDTSRPTVVRFARKLGFEGYADLQSQVQTTVVHALARPSVRIRARGSAVSTDREAMAEALDVVLEHLTDERIESLIAPLVGARWILVLSGETSQAGGRAMESGLTMLRGNVAFVEEHNAGSLLNHVDGRDVAVVFDFYRYRRSTSRAVAHCKAKGVTIVAVTDGPLSPLAPLADVRCDVTVPAVGPFDSSMPAVAVAELLVASLARTMADDAVRSIDRTEAAWAATDTFLN